MRASSRLMIGDSAAAWQRCSSPLLTRASSRYSRRESPAYWRYPAPPPRRPGARVVPPWIVLLAVLLALFFAASRTGAQGPSARIKDVARIVGVRDNELYGYGIVMGLNGTGDRRQSSFFTAQALQNLLARQGIVLSPANRSQLDTKNLAAVMVTAKLPAFARAGTALDVTVSSIGDASSLLGGTLLITPLAGADNQVYAVATGPVSIGGGFSVSAGGTGEAAQKNHPTVGRIVGGATVERELPMPINLQRLTVALIYPDFTTAAALAQSVNTALGSPLARAADSATVVVDIPTSEQPRLVDFVSRLEQVTLPTDAPAKVVVNERTGTVIIGSQVRISTVAVSHGNLSISIKAELQVSQPPPFAPPGAATVVVPKTDMNVKEDKASLAVVPSGASIGDVVGGLNAIGVTPRDLIAILQAMKRAGALNAELEVM